jgi:molecular chaperone GrpE
MAAPSEDKTDTPVLNNPNEAGSSEASSEAVSAPTTGERAKPEGERPTPEPAGEAPANPPEPDSAELKDRLLRVLADQENFRRRIERERDEAIRFAATQLVKDLLQTADNLARALQSVPSEAPAENQALQNLLTGVAASERALQDTFARHGIRQIQPSPGEAFDPNQHHAMFESNSTTTSPARSPRLSCLVMPITSGFSVRRSSPLPNQNAELTGPIDGTACRFGASL